MEHNPTPTKFSSVCISVFDICFLFLLYRCSDRLYPATCKSSSTEEYKFCYNCQLAKYRQVLDYQCIVNVLIQRYDKTAFDGVIRVYISSSVFNFRIQQSNLCLYLLRQNLIQLQDLFIFIQLLVRLSTGQSVSRLLLAHLAIRIATFFYPTTVSFSLMQPKKNMEILLWKYNT